MIRFVRKLAVLPVHASGHDGPEFRSLHETPAVDAYRELFGLLVEWVSIRGLTVPGSVPSDLKKKNQDSIPARRARSYSKRSTWQVLSLSNTQY